MQQFRTSAFLHGSALT